MTRLLIVTAVRAEHDCAIFTPSAGVNIAQSVIIGGVGPAASAAATSAALATAAHEGRPYDVVISAGIGGGFTPLVAGNIAVASSIVFADLGAETADGFSLVSALGLGVDRYDVDPQMAVQLADLTGGHLGAILTVATVTGTASTAGALIERHPDAVAEAMEGAGVAAAAVQHGVAFGEIRAISNAVGPRNRDGWQIPEALTALGSAVAAILAGYSMP